MSVARRAPFRSAVASAQRPVETMPSTMTITPQPATTAHAAWLACTKPTELEAMIARSGLDAKGIAPFLASLQLVT